jgi:hypothetical protein
MMKPNSATPLIAMTAFFPMVEFRKLRTRTLPAGAVADAIICFDDSNAAYSLLSRPLGDFRRERVD